MAIDSHVAEVVDHIRQTLNHVQIAQLARLISPVSPCASMSADEFERVMSTLAGQPGHRAFSDRSMKVARLVLVMGASIAEAAAETGLARQVAYRLMARVRARIADLPGDWIKVEVWLPPAAAAQVTAHATSLRIAHQTGQVAAESVIFE